MHIYESPDKGKTVYKREFGSSEKTIIKSPPAGAVYIPGSVGDLFDRITILQIKMLEIKDEVKLNNIDKEHRLLVSLDTYKQTKDIVNKLFNELFVVNYKIWNLEDDIRDLIAVQSYGEHFINVAKLIPKTNDERARIKKEINLICNSELIEEKSYHGETNEKTT
jgi:hypothetical protein